MVKWDAHDALAWDKFVKGLKLASEKASAGKSLVTVKPELVAVKPLLTKGWDSPGS